MGIAVSAKAQLVKSTPSSRGEHHDLGRVYLRPLQASRQPTGPTRRIRIVEKGCADSLKLLALCAQSRPSLEDVRSIRSLSSDIANWSGVLALAGRHRLLPLLSHTLQTYCPGSIPDEVLRHLESSLRASARINLELAAKLTEVLDAFDSQGVRVLPYKGPVLGSMLYGNPALRPTTDLDLLVRKSDLVRANDVLRDIGFHPAYALNSTQESSLARTDCERMFLSAENIQVDLHWGIAPELYAIRFDEKGLWSRLQVTTWAGRDIAVFASEDLFLCLCQHAAKHLWSEIILLADIAELVRSRPTLDWDFIFEQAKWSRSERIVCCSLLLICHLWQLNIPGELVSRFTADHPGVCDLVAEIAADLEESVSGLQKVWRTHRLNSRLRQNWRERMHYWLSVISKPTLAEFGTLRLPASLTRFYVPLRFCRLLRKSIQGVARCRG
jgi:hypothetical protein